MGRETGRERVLGKASMVLGAGILIVGLAWAFAEKPQVAAASYAAKSASTEAAPSLPAPGTYKIDPVHSFVYFSAWHHVVGVVRGRFDKATGTITASQNPAACAVDVTIDAYTLSTQFTERDDDLRGPDFFDVRKFPTMTYQGRGIRPSSNGQWTMDGTLTIRGASKVVPVVFTFKGLFPDTKPGQPARAAFRATAATRRGDFGMTRDNLMELGVPPAPGNDVDIQIDIEADADTPKK
jgi:polyisoprenoid-binding protein YceI